MEIKMPKIDPLHPGTKAHQTSGVSRHAFLPNMVGFWRRPSLYIGILSIVAYWDRRALHGKFVYDDAGTLKKNVVVNGSVPWTDVFTRDFWGMPMADVQSHKSFRPITTITFRLNWILSEWLGQSETDQHTYGFHLVNVGLHGLVTTLITEAAAFVFCGGTQSDMLAITITGAIFAFHPVHAEAVSNLTSRGELLMSCFFLTAFLVFAPHVSHGKLPKPGIWSFFAIYIIPFLCMTISLFCKEQGATTLITLVIYDFVHNHGSVRHFLGSLTRQEASAVAFVRRTLTLAFQTVLVCLWRYHLNGETSPDFVYSQNPAGFSSDRFTRVFSVNWVYLLYLRDAVDPRFLSPDWSGRSIDLIESISDIRILGVLALWGFVAGCVLSLLSGWSWPTPSVRRVILLAFLAFTFAPFLLSSNILVVVGLMKADRVIYLPLFGFCILEALALQMVFFSDLESSKRSSSSRRKLGYVLVMWQVYFFCRRVHERNIAWSDPLNLWAAAYRINPRSYHTMYNTGYELAQRHRYAEAEPILRPIGDPSIDGPSNTFVYTMVLQNLDRCDESLPLVEKALAIVEEKKQNPGVRDDERTLARIESNLKLSKGFCAENIMERGKLFFDAVQTDQTNEYAIQQATILAKEVERIRQYQGRT